MGMKNHPDFITANVVRQKKELDVVRSILAGWPTYKELLIQRENETSDTFAHRQSMPLLFDSLTPTIDNHVGRILDSFPTVRASESFEILTNNIDAQGTPLKAFLKRVLWDATAVGHSFILVDHPQLEAPTRGDELQSGVRPYWVHVQKEQIQNFRTGVVNGVLRVTQASIAETILQPDDFDNQQIPQWRVVRLREEGATWQLYRRNKEKVIEPFTGETPFVGAGGRPFDEIPMIPFYTNYVGMWESRPFYIELARNVQYAYNLATDMDIAHANASYARQVFKGMSPEDVEGISAASDKGIVLSDINQEYSLVSGKTEGVAMTQTILQGLQQQAQVLGVRMHETNRPDRETAVAKNLDKEIDQLDVLQTNLELVAALKKTIELTELYLNKVPLKVEVGEQEPEPTPKPLPRVEPENRMLPE